MSDLIVSGRKVPDKDGNILRITPDSAGWDYVGFQVFSLGEGQSLRQDTRDREVCLVLLSGKGDVATSQAEWKGIGKRMNVFDKTPPYAVYVPSNDFFYIQAATALEIAVPTIRSRLRPGMRFII